MSKCEAKTSEGKACFFEASKTVQGHRYCGNHAARMKLAPPERRAILFSRAPKTALSLSSNAQARLSEAAAASMPVTPILESMSKPRMVDQVFALIEAGIPKGVIEQILQAWKVGAL